MPALLTLAAAQATAMHAPAACTAPGKLPSELADWATPRALTAPTISQELSASVLSLGAGARATLAATPRLAYPVQPAHPGNATTHGGLFAFT